MHKDFPDDFRIFDKSGALGLIADYASKSCIYPIIHILLISGSYTQEPDEPNFLI